MLRHPIIAVALLVFLALDLVFVSYSNAPLAALTFAIISFLILSLMAAAAGSFMAESEESGNLLQWVLPDPLGSLRRVLLAWVIPAILVAAVAFVPSLSDPRDVNPAVQLGSVFVVFWLLGSISLTGAALGFVWPRTGAFEAVIVGALLVVFQVFLTWVRLDITQNELQMGLFNLMVWVSLCLMGAWVGTILRQVGETHLYEVLDEAPDEVSLADQESVGGEYSGVGTVPDATPVVRDEDITL